GGPRNRRRAHQPPPGAGEPAPPDELSPDGPASGRRERATNGPGNDRSRIGNMGHGGFPARSFFRVPLLPPLAVARGKARGPSGRERAAALLVDRLGVRPPLRPAFRQAVPPAGRSGPT